MVLHEMCKEKLYPLKCKYIKSTENWNNNSMQMSDIKQNFTVEIILKLV